MARASVSSEDRGEAGASAEGAHGVERVVSPLGEPVGGARRAVGVLVGGATVCSRKLEVTEFLGGASARVGGGEALGDELVGPHLEMEAQLGVDVARDGGA